MSSALAGTKSVVAGATLKTAPAGTASAVEVRLTAPFSTELVIGVDDPAGGVWSWTSTLIVTPAVCVPAVAETDVLPAPSAATTPLGDTLATAGFEEVQETGLFAMGAPLASCGNATSEIVCPTSNMPFDGAPDTVTDATVTGTAGAVSDESLRPEQFIPTTTRAPTQTAVTNARHRERAIKTMDEILFIVSVRQRAKGAIRIGERERFFPMRFTRGSLSSSHGTSRWLREP